MGSRDYIDAAPHHTFGQVGGAPQERQASIGSKPEHPNMGGARTVLKGTPQGEAGKANHVAPVAIQGTETPATSLNRTASLKKIKSFFTLKSGPLSLGERVMQFSRKLFRSAEAKQIHEQTRNELEDIFDLGIRARLKPILDRNMAILQQKTPATPEEIDHAKLQLDMAHREIQAEVKAQKYAAGIIPSKEREEVKKELRELYLAKAAQMGNAKERDARIAILENMGRLTLPKPENGGAEPAVIQKKIFLALANQEKMKLWNQHYEKLAAEFEKKDEKLSSNKRGELEGQRGELERAGNRAALAKLKGPRHPKDMTREEFQRISETIDSEIDKIVTSSEFQSKLKRKLGQSGGKYEIGQKLIDGINKETVTKATFLIDIQGKSTKGISKGTSLAQLLFPLRSEDTTSTQREELAPLILKRSAIDNRPILNFVPSPQYTVSDGLIKTNVVSKKPAVASLGSVQSFKTDNLRQVIISESKNLKHLTEQLQITSDAKTQKDIETKIHQTKLLIGSTQLQLRMQSVMENIHEKYKNGKITEREAKQELRELHEGLLEQYDQVRNDYSDAQILQRLEGASMLTGVTAGVRGNPLTNFGPSTFASADIRDELYAQMFHSMGFKETTEGGAEARIQLRHQIEELKLQIKGDISQDKSNALRAQLYPLIMKLHLYEGIDHIQSLPESRQQEAIETLHSRLQKQNMFFKEKLPNAADYGDTSKLADLDISDFAKSISRFLQEP